MQFENGLCSGWSCGMSASLRTVTAVIAIAIAAHIAVFGWRVLSVERRLTLDSYNYISVARNISAGEGIVQSTAWINRQVFWARPLELGFREKTEATHNIGYPLLILAVNTVTGLEFVDSALFISVVAYAVSLLLAYRVAFLLGGRDTVSGLLTVAIALHMYHRIYLHAWSEPFSIAALLAMIALMAGGMTPRRSLLSGTIAGTAMLARTAMLPMVALGLLACLIEKRDKWRNMMLFIVAPVGFTLLTATAVREQIVHKKCLFDVFLDFFWLMREEFAALAILSLLCMWLYRHEIPLAKLKRNSLILFLVAWVGGYSLFMILAQWQYSFELTYRTVSPLEAVLVLLYGTLLSLILRRIRGIKWASRVGFALLAVSIAFALGRDRYYLTLEEASDESHIVASERLKWVQENIGSGDFIIGADTVDLTYYFEHQVPTSASFSPIPAGTLVTDRILASLVRSTCSEYGSHYLVLRKFPASFDMVERYGTHIRDLMARKPTEGYELVADLADGTIYRMNHCKSLRE